MTKNIIVTAVVALVVSIVCGLFFVGQTSNQSKDGSSNQGNGESVTGLSERDVQAISLKVGPTGTKHNQINTGTCYLQPNATTIAATTTVNVECQGTALIYNPNTVRATALSGVKNGDRVNVTLSTTTASATAGNIVLVGASASTTAGYITLRIANFTGTVFTWPLTGNATGTASYITSR